MRELGVIQQPKMLLADDFKAYSKLKVENHASIVLHYQATTKSKNTVLLYF